MKTKYALDVIHRSLVSYIEDSAGANSDEAKEIYEAYLLVLNKICATKFSYKCSITGESFNGGYYIESEDKYIKYDKDLVAWLRGRGVDKDNELSDEFLINESDELDEFTCLASIETDENNYYDEDGNHCSSFPKQISST